MIEVLEAEVREVADDLSPADVLSAIRERRAAEDRAAADLLVLAATWADFHPPESIHSAATFLSAGV